MADFDKLRLKIDSLDEKLIALLEKRLNYVREIGELKNKPNSRNKALFRPEREQEIQLKIKEQIADPAIAKAIKHTYTELMSASKAIEGGIKTYYLGPAGSFTHQAALKKFGGKSNLLPVKSIDEVFQEVQKRDTVYGVVPIENSTEGMVNNTLDNLIRFDLSIYAEVQLDIEHCLIGKAKNYESIKTIYTHPQAFAQCRGFILGKLSPVDWVETKSTSEAVEIVSKSKSSSIAAIGSAAAAKNFKCKIVEKNIGDYARNTTRFIVIGHDKSSPGKLDRTLISFVLPDSAGALQVALEPFREYGVNLTSIESRPTKNQNWSYVFFVDCEGHHASENLKKCLEQLKENSSNVRILGSYPKDV